MFDRTYYATHPDMMECVSNEELTRTSGCWLRHHDVLEPPINVTRLSVRY